MKDTTTIAAIILVALAVAGIIDIAVGSSLPAALSSALTGTIMVAAGVMSAKAYGIWKAQKAIPGRSTPQTTRHLPVLMAINSLKGSLATSRKPVGEQLYILSWMTRQDNLSLPQLERLTASLLDRLVAERYRSELPKAVREWHAGLPSRDKQLGNELAHLYMDSHMAQHDGVDELLLLEHMTGEVKRELRRLNTASSADQRWI